jgi:TRAP-type C4-dicarboxylate transport system permease large subunit
MQQTASQIRVGGLIALSISALNLVIFGLFAAVERNARFVLGALPSVVVVATMGAIFYMQADRIAQQVAPSAKAGAKTSAENAQALRRMGNILLLSGIGLLIVCAVLSSLTAIAAFFLAAIAPGVLLGSMGLLYIVTSPTPKR